LTHDDGHFCRRYFSRFDVEQDADFVRVYDSATKDNSKLISALSGHSLPRPIKSTSGSLYVEMSSDAANQYVGEVDVVARRSGLITAGTSPQVPRLRS
jgi:hypothetical protein